MSHLVFQPGRARGSFTLLEMLVVMAIMGILLYLTIPAMVALQQSSNLGIAGQAVADEISVAREMAASQNLRVEIQFRAPTNYTGYHALQLWAQNESGVSVPVDRIITLPDGVEISTNSTLSPLLSTLVGPGASITNGPAGGTSVSFFVRPNGTVQVANPPADAASGSAEDNANGRQPSYFFTIVPVWYGTASSLPPNYFTLQVNPDTGRSQAYRP